MRSRFSYLICIVFLVWAYSNFNKNNESEIPSTTNTANLRVVRVLKVIDGDSLLVKDGNKKINLRLIGIDAPETSRNEKALRDSTKNGTNVTNIIAAGYLARTHLVSLLKNNIEVQLSSDSAKFDKYGRTLAYLYTKDNIFVNLQMLKDGYAKPLEVRPNLKFSKTFRKTSQQARKKQLGLWAQKPTAF